MDRPVPQEFRLGESRNHLQHSLLLGNAKTRLEPDQIPHPSRAILLSKLNDGVRVASGARIAKTYRLERAEPEGVASALRPDFDRHAALEVWNLVELVAVVLVGGDQRVEERIVLLARHRAVQIRAAVVGAIHRLLAV